MKTEIKEINSYTRKLNVIVKWDSLNSNYPDYHMVGGKNDITLPGLKNVRKHVSD